jgi:hypothetical protein
MKMTPNRGRHVARITPGRSRAHATISSKIREIEWWLGAVKVSPNATTPSIRMTSRLVSTVNTINIYLATAAKFNLLL